MSRNKNENNLINGLDEKALWETLGPIFKGIIKHGTGNADDLIKKSQAVAALTMIKSLMSDKDDVKLRAATELLNRSLGKPVERKIDIYANLNEVSEAEIDTRLKTLFAETNNQGDVIDAVFESVPKFAANRRKKQTLKLKQAPKKHANEEYEREGQASLGPDGPKPGSEA